MRATQFKGLFNKEFILEVIVFLIVLLLLYAGGSKLIGYEIFVGHLAKSPLLNKYSGTIAWVVPVVEFLIVIPLIVSRYRSVGMYAAFGIMVTFTLYIAAMLTFTKELPCACGGILSSMDWVSHLVFNIFFTGLCVVGIALVNRIKNPENKSITKTSWRYMVIIFSSALMSIAILYKISSSGWTDRQSFIRKFNDNLIRISSSKLGKGQYVAGHSADRFYIGNSGDVSGLILLDTLLNEIDRVTIEMPSGDVKGIQPWIVVDSSTFFVMDGKLPVILKGDTGSWKANKVISETPYFSQIIPLNEKSFVLSSVVSKNGGTSNYYMLGLLTENPFELAWHPTVIDSEADSLYKSMGHLRYSKSRGKVIYVYVYQSKYVVMDSNLNPIKEFKTIDSAEVARLQQVEVSPGVYTLKSLPGGRNRHVQIHDNLMLIFSGTVGQNEEERMVNNSSVIDVYDFLKGQYQFSFHVPNEDDQRIKQFKVYGDKLFAIYSTSMVVYSIKHLINTGEDRKPGRE